METLESLKLQREDINQKIRELERQTLAEIEAKAAALGYQVVKSGMTMPAITRPKAKYRSVNGEEWSGKGRKPRWAQDIEDQGGNLEDYRVG